MCSIPFFPRPVLDYGVRGRPQVVNLAQGGEKLDKAGAGRETRAQFRCSVVPGEGVMVIVPTLPYGGVRD